MKKIICLILMISMLLTALPALADNVWKSGNFWYTVKGNGTATIVGYVGKHTDIILPNFIDGYTITTIGEGAFAAKERGLYKEGISVTLPDTITSIEEKAFANREVISINIPDAVEYIGYGAFLGCNKISFRLSSNHPFFATINGSLYNKLNKELVKWAVNDLSDDIIVPEGILSIGDYAFADISINYRASVSLPQTLKRIGNYAFWLFRDDTGVLDIPASVSEIGASAFAGADMNIDISRCTQLETIPERAFAADGVGNLLEKATVTSSPKNIKNIEAHAFDRGYIIDLNSLLSNVEKIGPYAFTEICIGGKEKSINIPGTCTIVDNGAFYKCSGSDIEEINIAQGVERIESKAFLSEGNFPVESVYLPASLSYIALDAFDKGVTFVVEKGSYAQRWADENAFNYSVNGEEQNLDWLNN